MTQPEPGGGQRRIEAVLPAVLARLPEFLPAQRWFGGKGRAIQRVTLRDGAALSSPPGAVLALIDVEYGDGAPATYFLPLLVEAAGPEPGAGEIAREGGIAVREAVGDAGICRALLKGILAGQTLPTTQGGQFVFQPSRREGADLAWLTDLDPDALPVRHAGVEQSNSSVIFGKALILKALRRVAAGVNPEIEILRFLGEQTTFDRVPPLVGWAEYQGPDGSAAPVGVLQRFIPNQGDGWAHVLERAGRAAQGSGTQQEADALVGEIAALGRTLAGLHLALASRLDVPDFAPAPITSGDVSRWRERTVASLEAALRQIGQGEHAGWTAECRDVARTVCAGADRLRAALDGFRPLADGRVVKTRHHGDFHLGQTLVADDGWIIIDFEGEPLRSLAERRAKQTPLRDVAGLLRSLDYARATVKRDSGTLVEGLFTDARAALLTAYTETVRTSDIPLLPASEDDLTRVLLALETEKALYELAYELGNRPDWVSIPLGALARLARAC